ncbi:MAG: hypothetical protein LC776_11785 [Acidobacteria bacterium]|nr:hypothetical protein [Acidobacteriota bacterium]
MPISTPTEVVPQYNNDGDHFLHVLEHLFKPAIEEAGFRPLTPVASGADLIHAEIVRQLETSDLVLCDMSTLNPNVFFELGIRTAVDKPVSLVHDDLTPRIPFDAGILHAQTYDGSLTPWSLPGERAKLTAHVRNCAAGSDGRNSLWRYFGLTSRASFARTDESGIDERVDFLVEQVGALSRAFESGSSRDSVTSLTHAVVGREPTVLEVSRMTEAVFDMLTEEERRILELRFGIDGYNRPKTLGHVASAMGSTPDRIHQREVRAIKKLREAIVRPEDSK